MGMRIKGILLIFTFSALWGSLAVAGSNDLDRIMSMVMKEMINSLEFKNSMACFGVSDQKKKNYLEQFEKDYRFCIDKFPQSEDGGVAFMSCWAPKNTASFAALDIEKSVVKKCEL